jgi:hypothetical protein
MVLSNWVKVCSSLRVIHLMIPFGKFMIIILESFESHDDFFLSPTSLSASFEFFQKVYQAVKVVKKRQKETKIIICQKSPVSLSAYEFCFLLLWQRIFALT